MGARRDQPAGRTRQAGAAAGARRRIIALAQPGGRHRERQLELPHTLHAVQQQCMPARAVQGLRKRRLEPGQQPVVAPGAHQPRSASTAAICTATWSRDCEASMRTKRSGWASKRAR